MELFSNLTSGNLLPYDGEVVYCGSVISAAECDHYFSALQRTVEWKHDEAFIFGRHYITKRMAAWYGDKPYSYTYSNTTKVALPWTRDLLALKDVVSARSGATFNSCLLNLYQSGGEGMAWHSDDEKMLLRHGTIASLTLGAERPFHFRHKKTGERVSLTLKNGSLLLMRGETQTNWLHALPKTKKVTQPRINLTFRTMDVAVA